MTTPKKKTETVRIDAKEIMKQQLRQEIVDKAKHIDACEQDLQEIEKQYSDKMNALYKVQVEKQHELALLKQAALKNFGIVFLKPERYEQYLH